MELLKLELRPGDRITFNRSEKTVFFSQQGVPLPIKTTTGETHPDSKIIIKERGWIDRSEELGILRLISMLTGLRIEFAWESKEHATYEIKARDVSTSATAS